MEQTTKDYLLGLSKRSRALRRERRLSVFRSMLGVVTALVVFTYVMLEVFGVRDFPEWQSDLLFYTWMAYFFVSTIYNLLRSPRLRSEREKVSKAIDDHFAAEWRDIYGNHDDEKE